MELMIMILKYLEIKFPRDVLENKFKNIKKTYSLEYYVNSINVKHKTYEPDFLIEKTNGSIELVEMKGTHLLQTNMQKCLQEIFQIVSLLHVYDFVRKKIDGKFNPVLLAI